MAARYHPETAAQLLNLHWDKKEQVYSGTLKGYPVFIKWYPGDMGYSVSLFAKHPQDERCKAEIAAFRQAHPCCCFTQLRDGVLSASCILQPGTSEAAAAGELDAFAAFGASLGLIPCCTGCGAENVPAELYLIEHTSGAYFCPQCSGDYQAEAQRANSAVRSQKPSVTGTAIGIGIMVLYLFVMLFVLSAGELFGGFGAAVEIFVAILIVIGMIHKYGGTVTRGAAIASVIACLIASTGFLTLRRAVDLAKFNRENLAQFERFGDYFAVTDSDGDPYTVFAGDEKMMGITEMFADYTPEKLQASRAKAEYACRYHTVGSVLLHLPEGLRKVSSPKQRQSFRFALLMAAVTSVWCGTVFWKPFLRRLRDRFQAKRLPGSPGTGQLPVQFS